MSTYTPSYQNNNRIQRSPSSKVSYSPGNWKNYVVKDFFANKDNRTSRDSLSNRALSPSNSINQLASGEKNYQEEKNRKKQQMMKRVKEIQNKVMPLIENENHLRVEEQAGWETKLQKRISKLQTAIDAIEKEMEIKMEKHIIELEKRFAEKIKYLQAQIKQ